jgi:hypothetical protein
MNTKKNLRSSSIIAAVCLLVIIVLIKVATFFPDWIENNFSRGFYPGIARLYRRLFGGLPFSLGDILYLIAAFFLLLLVVKFVKIVIRRRIRLLNYKRGLLKAFSVCAIIYILFNISWGLNYNRLGIAYQLKLEPEEYTVTDLKNITGLLLLKVNQDRLALGDGKIHYPLTKQIFWKANNAYQNASFNYPFLQYKTCSIKQSLYGRLGSLMGFFGYYNPFTGEAQLNLTQPRFLIPFVTCHEMAHQLGYASESEASFVGYLAAVESKDTLFKYSTYFDLFNYANRELYSMDSVTALRNYKRLDTLVKIDVAELKEYFRKSHNAIEPLIRLFYDQYLKANQQDKGVKSYDQVIGWLIAYNKKYKRL